MQNITEQEARAFYRQKYIVELGFDRIASTYLMACVADAGVNHGPRRAVKWLQQAVDVQQDGVLGPVTLQAVNRQDDIVTALKFLSYRIKFYGHIVTRAPSQAVFAKGWNARAALWLEKLVDRYKCG